MVSFQISSNTSHSLKLTVRPEVKPKNSHFNAYFRQTPEQTIWNNRCIECVSWILASFMSKTAFATLAHTRAGMRNSHAEVDNRSNFGLFRREFSQVVVKPHLILPILSQDSLGFFFWRSTKTSSQSCREKASTFYSWTRTQFDCTWFLLHLIGSYYYTI